MAVTSKILEIQNSISRLKKLSETLPSALSEMNKMQELVNENILNQEEIDSILNDYKLNIKNIIQDEINKAKDDSTSISTAAETETSSIVKGITPLISGSPVITPPPPTFATKEISNLSSLPNLTKQLTDILKVFNDVLS